MSDAKKAKILTTARSVFLRYGFKRVSMNDIAEAVGISRAALYLAFKNKEEIFVGVFQQWVDETLAEIATEMDNSVLPQDKLKNAFEIWAVRPFAMMMQSAEAKELVECSFDFAQESLSQGYKKFEATIVPVLAWLPEQHSATKARIDPERVAHLLTSAVLGFKQTATTPAELRLLIEDFLALCLPSDTRLPGASSRF